MAKLTIHIAGDSTAAIKQNDKRPETGWGEKITDLFTDDIAIVNHAVNGRSTKSFIAEGRLTVIDKQLQAGDYFFIQFGHNDQKIEEERGTQPFRDYQQYLQSFCQVAHDKNAFPVLLTSVTRRDYLSNGGLNPHTLGDYPKAMIDFANKNNLPLLDIFSASQYYFNKLSKRETKNAYLHLSAGTHPNYPDGVKDNTHFSDLGAQMVATLICKEIEKSSLPLKKFLKG